MQESTLPRRQFLKSAAATATVGLAAATGLLPTAAAAAEKGFKLHYILSSAMYGKMKLSEILPEVAKTGSEAIDIWCLPHGDQREQIDAMGVDVFAELLQQHKVKLGVLTRYPLGPFGLQDEMTVAKKLGGQIVLSATRGPKNVSGDDAKQEIKKFLEQMKPHADAAGEAGVRIALENHANALLYHPDSIRYFAEFNKSPHLGVAFAPHHLHEWVPEMPKLIEALGPNLAFFYAQEHGKGSKQAQPKEDEMLQMPGFGGGLDYRPLVAALAKIKYDGWIEPFMHPFPRGVPVLPTAADITAAINKSRKYLDECAAAV